MAILNEENTNLKEENGRLTNKVYYLLDELGGLG
jgi:hypothetical protein